LSQVSGQARGRILDSGTRKKVDWILYQEFSKIGEFLPRSTIWMKMPGRNYVRDKKSEEDTRKDGGG
jgi:hypothetical protein